jgi:4'-phosphopantetheinyl transferase
VTPTIDLWDCSLHGERSSASLSTHELGRAATFVFAEDRQRFVTAHVLLREILAHHVGCAAREIAFTFGAHGKPQIAAAEWAFNLAHSGDRMLVAVTRGANVGVDLERELPMGDIPAIVARFFAPSECARWVALPGDDQRAWFYRQWVAKEAVLKADGSGMAMASDAFEIRFDDGGEGRVQSNTASLASHWHVRCVDVGTGWHAAVAHDGPPRALHVRSLSCAGA